MKVNYLKYLPTIFTSLGCIGVVGTTVLSAKATPKACDIIAEYNSDKCELHGDGKVYHVTQSWSDLDIWQKGKKLGPVYTPTAASCAGTIACIVLSDIFARRYHAAVTKSLASIALMYKAGTDAFKKREAERKATQYDFDSCDPEKIIVFDEYFLEPIEISRSDLYAALYEFNRNYQLRGYGPLFELYEFITNDEIVSDDSDPAKQFGWSIDLGEEYGYIWIDFCLEPVDEEKRVYVLKYPFEPLMGYMYGWEE